MPIVGPITPVLTAPAVGSTCTSSVLLETEKGDWWHPTVFVTSPSALTSFGAPDLLTFYDYPSECTDRWMMPLLRLCGNSNLTTVFSMDPSKSIVSDPLYRSCQRYSTPIYSPGVCPRGFSIAEVTAVLSGIASGNKTFWQASCCRRFEHTRCLPFTCRRLNNSLFIVA